MFFVCAGEAGGRTGDYVIEASSTQLPQTENKRFTITAKPAAPFYLSKYSGDQQFGTKNKTLVYPLTVKVMDEYLNPVPNVDVEFWANTSQGDGQPSTPTATTNAGGLAQAWWTVGDKAQCQLIVQKLGLRPWPEDAQNTFVAFPVDNKTPLDLYQPQGLGVMITGLFQSIKAKSHIPRQGVIVDGALAVLGLLKVAGQRSSVLLQFGREELFDHYPNSVMVIPPNFSQDGLVDRLLGEGMPEVIFQFGDTSDLADEVGDLQF